ncbi:MAG: diacylglycerol kinase family lipid kinase [Eubacterium sp.]|nr:diacylglycerol kinase family lipid kinase [Eubacterium sp.]MCI9617623.1 diacylglycerol kinase family lipid kinase [Eubacterium sp.]
MKKLLFIVNPKAGLKKNRNYIDEAVQVFEEAGYKVGIKYTKKRLDGTNIAREHGARVDLVVCMGGDGTLNEVIQGMAEKEITTPLGYIPAGSTNDFAASLGLSSNPKTQAEFIVSHEAKPLDMGMFNGRYFVYTASAGIFTETSYSTPQKMKNRLGHFAYILHGSRELFRIRSLKLKIELEHTTHEGKYIFAAINNATKVGGIMKLDKEAVEFNDGEFELMLVEFPKNPVEFIRLAVKIFTQQFTGKITLEKIKSARITDCTDIDWSLDGEKEKGRAVVDFKVIHDAVNFIY